jgi:hypothetical protein
MQSAYKLFVGKSLVILLSVGPTISSDAKSPQTSTSVSVPAGGLQPVPANQPTSAVLEILVSDSPARSPDGSFIFRVVTEDRFPETNKPTGHPHVEFSPYISFKEIGHEPATVPGRTEWTYSAKLDGDDKNLVRLRVSICEANNCTGKLDKSKQRVVDVGSAKFDDYSIVVHPRQFVAGRRDNNVYIDLERQGHVITPTSTLKLHVSARDGCVEFESKGNATKLQNVSIDLVIDAANRRSQTEYFIIKPINLPPENCEIDVAVYDDEKQRATPLPDQLAMKTNTIITVTMSFLGCLGAFVFLLWPRIRRRQKPMVTWSDMFEILAKGFLAVLLGIILTKTDFIGITIDKTSANGFFTTGFFLGFLPLDVIFDRILRGLGVNPPSKNVVDDAQPATS